MRWMTWKTTWTTTRTTTWTTTGRIRTWTTKWMTTTRKTTWISWNPIFFRCAHFLGVLASVFFWDLSSGDLTFGHFISLQFGGSDLWRETLSTNLTKFGHFSSRRQDLLIHFTFQRKTNSQHDKAPFWLLKHFDVNIECIFTCGTSNMKSIYVIVTIWKHFSKGVDFQPAD